MSAGSEVSRGARTEITTKYARDYKKVSKKNRGTVLDEVVAVTSWSRDNTRRRLTKQRSTHQDQADKPRHGPGSPGRGNAPTTQ